MARDIVDGEVGEIDHAHVIAHGELLGIGDTPEVAGIPFGGALRDSFQIGGQTRFVGGIAVGALPAGGLHEVAPQLLLPRPEGAAPEVAAAGERLPGVYRRVVDLLGDLPAASMDVVRGLLHRIEASDIDAAGVHVGPAPGDPVGQQLAHARGVLDPDRLAEPQAAGFRRLAHQRATVGGDREQAVEGVLLVQPQFAEHRSERHGALQRLSDLVDLQVAHRGGEPGPVAIEDGMRLHQAWFPRLIVTQFELTALGAGRVTGIAQIGGVALVAQQGVADLLAAAGEGVEGTEEDQRVFQWHQRQGGTAHGGGNRSPDTGGNDHQRRRDIALQRLDAVNPSIADIDIQRRGLGEGVQMAAGNGLLDQLAGNALGAWYHQPGVGIPEGAEHQVALQQREACHRLVGIDHAGAGTECLARGDLALELGQARVVADPCDLQPAGLVIVAHCFKEALAVGGGIAAQAVVGGHVAEVGGVSGGADVRGQGGGLQTHQVGPAQLDEVVDHRGTDDAAQADDHRVCLRG